MAKPPAGSSLLFGALADSGRIKQRKNGSYRMVLKGVDEVDWFTDRPERVAGEWSPKKLLKEWDVLFSDDEPNAQMSYTWTTYMDFVGAMKGRGNMSFEMFKPSLNKKRNKLSFEVNGIGKKNRKLVESFVDRDIEDISLFIDDGITGDTTVTMKIWNDSGLDMEMKSLSSNAVFGKPTNVSGYTDAELDEEDIFFTGGERGAKGVFEIPVTLKNGLQEPSVDVNITFIPAKAMPGSPLWYGVCDYSSPNSENGPTTVYYSIDGGPNQSVEATCGMRM